VDFVKWSKLNVHAFYVVRGLTTWVGCRWVACLYCW